jgi:hypothetical protein
VPEEPLADIGVALPEPSDEGFGLAQPAEFGSDSFEITPEDTKKKASRILTLKVELDKD